MNKILNNRKKTRPVNVRKIQIGGEARVSVQSMTKTRTENVEATLEQIKQLMVAGCEIIRIAIPNKKAAEGFAQIRKEIDIPLVADIHFDYRLALSAIQNGADKIRINPGNIGGRKRVEMVLKMAGDYNIPVRVGVNAGSIEKEMLEKYKGREVETLVESALRQVKIAESCGFEDLVLAVKASHVPTMIEANRLLSEKTDYPLHLGVTEAGTFHQAVIKSSVGIGTLLSEGIGDTLRVSITGDPVDEVKIGLDILKSLGLREQGVEIVSCPTCGRLEADLIPVVNEIHKRLEGVKKNLTIAIMGCVVNGPGEAKSADLGVACGKKEAIFFKNGSKIKKLLLSEISDTIVDEVVRWE